MRSQRLFASRMVCSMLPILFDLRTAPMLLAIAELVKREQASTKTVLLTK